MGNNQSEINNLKRIENDQEYQQFIKICQQVLRLKDQILKQGEKQFKGSKLLKVLIECQYFPDLGDHIQASIWVQNILINPLFPFQLIHPVQDSNEFLFQESEDYMFINEKFDIYEKDNYILNVNPMDGKRPFFYEQDVLKFYKLLKDPAALVMSMRILYQGIKMEAAHEGGTVIDYEYLGNMDKWKYDFQENLDLLPYVCLSNLLKDESEKLATFINLYNILIVNGIVHFGQQHGNRYIMTSIERLDFFQKYKYNIGGINFSLDDIEHGILRLNDAYGISKPKSYWVMLTKQTLSDKSKPRFTTYDPRNKYTRFSKNEPRIHFCLNCGFKSCPPIRVYDGNKLEQQLQLAATKFVEINVKAEQKQNGVITVRMSKIFQWYKNDFGETEQEVFKYLLNFANTELYYYLLKILKDQHQFQIIYNEYDWTANYKKKPQKNTNLNNYQISSNNITAMEEENLEQQVSLIQ